MSNTETETPLTTIRPIALKLIERLRPHCMKIELAGSIRRGKPMVGDIEIVAIPKVHYQQGLFGSSSKPIANELLDFLDGLVSSELITKGYSWGELNRKFFLRTKGGSEYKVDLFLCTPENWGNIFLIRTGSSDFSAAIMAHLNKLGMKHERGLLYAADGSLITCPTEELFFKAIQHPFIDPTLRTNHKWQALNIR